MNQVVVWTSIRYLLMIIGAFLVGKGYATQDQVDVVIQHASVIVGAVMVVAPVIWGWYVNWNTARVTAATAERVDAKTISPVTGTAQKPSHS